MTTRKRVPTDVEFGVLTEAGYRCAVPTCRTILAIDLHHLVQVSEGGENTIANLIALCPTCHALFHRGTIDRRSLYAWKGMLVSLGRAFDVDTIDSLLFLSTPEASTLVVTGDGVLKFSRLVATGLATFTLYRNNGPLVAYTVRLTERGEGLVTAWKHGDRDEVARAIAPSLPDGSPDPE